MKCYWKRSADCRSFFFSSRRRHTRLTCDWSSDVCSSDLPERLVRRVPLVVRVGDTLVPALALELWRVGTGARQFALSDAGNGLLQVEFAGASRSEERRVGKECRSRWVAGREKTEVESELC